MEWLSGMTRMRASRAGRDSPLGTSPAVQCLRLSSTAGAVGSIPGWRTKITHAAWCSRQIDRQTDIYNKKIIIFKKGNSHPGGPRLHAQEDWCETGETGDYVERPFQIGLRLGIKSNHNHHASSWSLPGYGARGNRRFTKVILCLLNKICLSIPDVNKDSSYLRLGKCMLAFIKLNSFN